MHTLILMTKSGDEVNRFDYADVTRAFLALTVVRSDLRRGCDRLRILGDDQGSQFYAQRRDITSAKIVAKESEDPDADVVDVRARACGDG